MENETMTFEQVAAALQYKPPACQLYGFTPVSNPDANDELVKKTRQVSDMRKKEGKQKFKDFRYFQAEVDIGKFTGKQLLQYLANLFRNNRDGSAIQDENCLLFDINGNNQLAILIPRRWCIENRTPATKNRQDKKLFYKLFDDKMSESYNIDDEFPKRPFFNTQHRRKSREGLKERFAVFMSQPITNERLPVAYRNAFMGVLVDIAKLQVRFTGNNNLDKARNELTKVPVAACVKLAIDLDVSGELQPVFGDHEIDYNPIDDKFRRDYCAENGRKPTIVESNENRIRTRIKLRMEAAKKIIDRRILPTEAGLYRKVDVDELADEVNSFYQD